MSKLYLPVCCLIMSATLLFCGSDKVEENKANKIERGKQLAQGLCGSCHMTPSPEHLDKHSWQHYALPRMGYFLGIYADSVSRESLIEQGKASKELVDENIFPEKPVLEVADWEALQAYYIESAPDSLTTIPEIELIGESLFQAVRPAFSLQPPSSTMVRFSENSDELFIGDAFTGALYLFDSKLQNKASAKTGEAPVWVTETDDEYLLTIMGSFSPTDNPDGYLMALPKNTNGMNGKLVEGLQRPVHHCVDDFNGDGKDDIVVSEFGKWTGGLTLFTKTDNGYVRQEIQNQTGAIRAYARDWNQDGRMDIVSMFAQGNEGIWAFMNDGSGKFNREEVLRFPPSYGSTAFYLRDLDADGDEDIVYVSGDNADFGPILRPYHGIRFYMNDGSMRFEEKVFIPINGAYGCEIQDFDLDGDLDVAAISFFPDFNKRESEGFVLFQNDGKWNFTASTFPEAKYGRWIVMDSKDIDNDGDTDIILGSLAFEVVGKPEIVQQWAEMGIPFILLENLSR